MLEMRPGCERCDEDLPADKLGAMIGSFECTFCVDCSDTMKNICQNCGGELVLRPAPLVRKARAPSGEHD